jgi:hypothetical protein
MIWLVFFEMTAIFILTFFQYDFQSEFGLYPHTAIPDPRLLTLGVKFHTMEEFSQEIKNRYA